MPDQARNDTLVSGMTKCKKHVSPKIPPNIVQKPQSIAKRILLTYDKRAQGKF